MIKNFTIKIKSGSIYTASIILCLIYTIFTTFLTIYSVLNNYVMWVIFTVLFSFPAWILFIRLLKTSPSKFEKQIIKTYLDEV